MKYFKNGDNVSAYDETDETQHGLIALAIESGWQDITGAWPPAPTTAQVIAQGELALQNALDAVAQSWGYDNLISAASYANSTVPQFKAEAEVLISWRDQTWLWGGTQRAMIEAGTIA